MRTHQLSPSFTPGVLGSGGSTPRVDQIIVGGVGRAAPRGVRVRNWHDASVTHFRHGYISDPNGTETVTRLDSNRQPVQTRVRPYVLPLRSSSDVDEVIVHETVTRTLNATIGALRGQGYSVHFIISPDGLVTQHGDLTARMVHAGSHNPRSVGIEIVNPFYTKPDSPPWNELVHDALRAPWAGGRYNPATPAQCEALHRLLMWLTSANSGLSIPRTWIGYQNGSMALGRVQGASGQRAGIYAHHYFHHGDGAFPVMYSWLRTTIGGTDEEGPYKCALELAEGARTSADVRGYLARQYPNVRVQAYGRARPTAYGQITSTIPSRRGGPTGSQFGGTIMNLGFPRTNSGWAARENAIYDQLVAGNVPDFLRNWSEIRATRSVGGERKTIVYKVTPDFLAVGTNSDYLLVPMDGITAQRVVDHYNCILPTARMVDQIYAKARAEGRNVPAIPLKSHPDGRQMSTDYYVRHDAAVKKRIKVLKDDGRYSPGDLVAGHKKNLISSKYREQYPNKLAFYGFFRTNHQPIQTARVAHFDGFADYSHGVRAVHKEVRVDGEVMEVSQVLAHPQLHVLLSDEGPVDLARVRYRTAR